MTRQRFGRLADRATETAPDGLSVTPAVVGERGGLAVFSLPPNTTGRAIRHRSVEELWIFTDGDGEMFLAGVVAPVQPGVTVRVDPGEMFQVRSFGRGLEAIAATMPLWPGDEEAEIVDGPWPPTA